MTTTAVDSTHPNTGWTTRDAVLVAVLAVIFGFLYIQWTPVWLAAAGLGAQVGQEAAFGFWLIAGVLASYIIRKPGAALIGEFLAALAEVIFGAPAGTPLLITGLMQGIGVEIVFGVRRWQDYSLTTMILAGAVGMLVALPWNWFRLGYFQLAPGYQLLLLIVRLLSGAIISGLLSKLIGDALARTGVLSNFAIGRERQEVV
jgi:energy-coupling factor transport system substrate-specific component